MFQLSLSTSLTPPTAPGAGLFPALSGAFSAVLAGVTADASAPIDPATPSPALRQPDAAAGKSLPIDANAGLATDDSHQIILLASAASPAVEPKPATAIEAPSPVRPADMDPLLAAPAAPEPADMTASPRMPTTITPQAPVPTASASPLRSAVSAGPGRAMSSDKEPALPTATITVALPTRDARAIPARSAKPKSPDDDDEDSKHEGSPPNLSTVAPALVILLSAPIDQRSVSVSLPIGVASAGQITAVPANPSGSQAAPIAAAKQTGTAAVAVASPRVGAAAGLPVPASAPADDRSPAPTGRDPASAELAPASPLLPATSDTTIAAVTQNRGIPTAAVKPSSPPASAPQPIANAKPARFEIVTGIGTSAIAPAPGSNPPSTAPAASNPAPAAGIPGVPTPVPGTVTVTDPTALAPIAKHAPQSASPAQTATHPMAPDTSPRPAVPDVRPQPAASIVSSSPATQPAGVLFGIAIGARAFVDDRRSPRDEALQALTAVAAAAGPAAPIAAPGGAQQGTLDMHRGDWPQAMIDHIEALRDAADATSTRITLMPDALGKVDVSLRHDGDTVHVHFAADAAQTRAILADAQPRLAELAQARGLRLGQATIDAGAGNGGQRQQPGNTAAPLPERLAPAFTTRTAEDAASSDSSRLA